LPSTIEQVGKEFNGRGLTVLAVNIREGRNRVSVWVKESKVTSKVLLDPDGALMTAYRVARTPTVVLVGRDGKLVGRAVGTRGWTTDAGRALFNALVEASPR
jgi:hypothetical protein